MSIAPSLDHRRAAAQSNFLADVVAMLERAAIHVSMQQGLLQKIKVCNET